MADVFLVSSLFTVSQVKHIQWFFTNSKGSLALPFLVLQRKYCDFIFSALPCTSMTTLCLGSSGRRIMKKKAMVALSTLLGSQPHWIVRLLPVLPWYYLGNKQQQHNIDNRGFPHSFLRFQSSFLTSWSQNCRVFPGSLSVCVNDHLSVSVWIAFSLGDNVGKKCINSPPFGDALNSGLLSNPFATIYFSLS